MEVQYEYACQIQPQLCLSDGARQACKLSAKLEVRNVTTESPDTGAVVVDYRISPRNKLDCQRALFNHIRSRDSTT